ncbi:MAG: 6-phosphofructokinase [Terriglobia bacterium]|nr:6-phosphofructokinase [Terriglobia bacterium]
MNSQMPRIAINIGSGYLPGIDFVVAGAVLAASELGWEIVGIRDGYDGLLFPGRYPHGGLVNLRPEMIDASGRGRSLIGSAARTDPFHVRSINPENQVEEVDRSDDLLKALHEAGIGAVISLVGGSAITGLHALSVAFKLYRKGLRTICVPKSVENEIACVSQAFGYNSVLSHTAETLERIRIGAEDVGRLAVVEVPGQHAGWLALQSGMAALADAILVPEIPFDLKKVADALRTHENEGRRPTLVVVADGARPVNGVEVAEAQGGLRTSLTPNADPDFGEGEHVIDRTGATSKSVAMGLQRLTDRDVLPFALGHLIRGGVPTVVDRQLGLAYGAGAVKALHAGSEGVMITFELPDIKRVPLAETLGRIRTVPAGSEIMKIARSLGIAFGD